MTTLDLLQQLHKLGVILTPYPDSTMHCRTPKGVLTPDLLDEIRQHKQELHALVEEWSERVAIAEYDGGLACENAQRLAWQCLLEEVHT